MISKISEFVEKLNKSVEKHGKWDDYNYDTMITKINDELEECLSAIDKDEYLGDHGLASELLDVAVTCVKMSYQITRRNKC